MSGYTTFAVVGAGNIGSAITQELVKTGSNVRVLSRTADKKVPEGAEVKVVDYESVDGLADALMGVDVVLVTLGNAGVKFQTPVLEASKKAGVKLVAPQEWGGDSDLPGSVGYLAARSETISHLQRLGIPYVRYYNGAWSDLALLPNGASALPNIDYGARKAWIVGDGNQKISFTKIEDIARFVAHSLTLFPAERLHNQTFRLEGDRKTWNEYFDLVERKAGLKYEVTRKDAEEVRKRIEGHEMEPKNLLEFIAWSWGTGGGLVGEPLANYDGWSPKKLEDLLQV